MRAHPIIDYPYRWFPMLVLALVLAIIQATLSWGYAGVDWLPAIIDGITTIGWFAALAYLAWLWWATYPYSRQRSSRSQQEYYSGLRAAS